jgi:hypothetical protein
MVSRHKYLVDWKSVTVSKIQYTKNIPCIILVRSKNSFTSTTILFSSPLAEFKGQRFFTSGFLFKSANRKSAFFMINPQTANPNISLGCASPHAANMQIFTREKRGSLAPFQPLQGRSTLYLAYIRAENYVFADLRKF